MLSFLAQRRARVGWALGLLVLVTVSSDAWWLARFQRGGPLFIDEAGEFASAAENTAALQHGGMSALWHAYQGRGPRAPLLSLVGVPFNLVLGRRMAAGYVEQLFFFIVLVVATYALARRLVGPWPSVLAAGIVATAPSVTSWTTAYYTPIPAYALLVAGVACLIWSDGLRNRWWAVAAGFLLGLTVLARAMTIGFVPVVFASAAIVLLADPPERARRLANLAIAGLMTAALAATWYPHNLQPVMHHLTNETDPYGRFQLDGLARVLYLPVAAVIGVVFAVAAWVLLRLRRGSHERTISKRRLDAYLLVLITVALAPVIVVNHKSDGEWIPAAVVVVVLAVAISNWLPWRAWRRGLLAALAIAAVCTAVMAADVIPRLSRPRYVKVAGLSLPLTDGRSFIQRRAEHSGYPPWDPAVRPPEAIRAWNRFNHVLASFVAEYATARGVVPCVFFVGTNRDVFVNPWSLEMDDRYTVHSGMFTGALDASDPAHGVDEYRRQMHDPVFGWPNVLIIMDEMPLNRSAVPPEQANTAARLEGFTMVKTLTMPDGRSARISWFPRGAPVRGGQRAYRVP